ncbi:hypothetical protein D3C87_1353250 [compost metagenome]
MQNNQLRLSALAGKYLRRHLEQGFVFGIFIRFKIPIFQELCFIRTLGNTGNGGVVLTNLSLIGEPPGLKTSAVRQSDEVILILRFTIHHAA